MKILFIRIFTVIYLHIKLTSTSVSTSFDKYYPSSCQDPSIINDGVYQIYPDGLVPVQVYCDVTKGGWTTIMNKIEKNDFFNRSWIDYLYGFGTPRGNYWAGLVNIRNLVLTEPMILRIELSNSYDDEFFIEYESFYVGSEDTGFVLYVGNRTRGNLMDTFSSMTRAKFFTHEKFAVRQPATAASAAASLVKARISAIATVASSRELIPNETFFENIDASDYRSAYFKGAWWYNDDGSNTVCLTCNPRTPFEGNWQQHTNLLTFAGAKMMLKPRNLFRPSNCYEIYQLGGIKQDGIYNIYLSSDPTEKPIRVYCEMQRGGWTRIFNRIDRLTPSYDRLWSEFKEGFGDLLGNHWLGLRAMQALTYHEQMMLRIEVASETRRDAEFIEYSSFLVYPESQRFKLSVNASSRGTLTDWLHPIHNGMAFLTKDIDSNSNCATEHLGGWWFSAKDCYKVCLTCAKLTHGQYSAHGGDSTMPSSRKHFMKMLIRPANA